MKKLSILMAIYIITAITAAAEPVKYFFMYAVGHEDTVMGSWFIMDTETMSYTADSDSDSDGVIKNYKKSGGKETFNVYFDGYLMHGVEITTDENGKKIFTYIYDGQPDTPVVLGTEEEFDAHREKIYGSSESGGSADASKPESIKEKAQNKVANKIKGGVNNVINKGKNLIKKKK